MHLLQPVGNDLERLAQPLLERRLQLLVDRRAHLFQLGGVVHAQRIEALFDCGAHGVQALLVGQRELGQLLAEALQLPLLQSGHVGELRLRGFAELADRTADFVAQSCGGAGLLRTRVGEVLPDVRVNARNLRAQSIAACARFGGFAHCFVAGPAQCRNAQQTDDAQHQQDDKQHEQGDLEYLGHGLGSLLGRGKRSKGREPVFAHVVASRQSSHSSLEVDSGRIAQDRCARIETG